MAWTCEPAWWALLRNVLFEMGIVCQTRSTIWTEPILWGLGTLRGCEVSEETETQIQSISMHLWQSFNTGNLETHLRAFHANQYVQHSDEEEQYANEVQTYILEQVVHVSDCSDSRLNGTYLMKTCNHGKGDCKCSWCQCIHLLLGWSRWKVSVWLVDGSCGWQCPSVGL